MGQRCRQFLRADRDPARTGLDHAGGNWLAFYVGLVAAIRAAPQVPLGIPAGIVADWLDRRLLLIGVTLVTTLVALAAATLTGVGLLAAPVILIFAPLFGLLDTLRTTVTQAHAYEDARSTNPDQ